MNLYKKLEMEDGPFCDSESKHWVILQARAATGCGWERFISLEAAAAAWNLKACAEE